MRGSLHGPSGAAGAASGPGNFFAEEKSGRRAGAGPATKSRQEEYNKLYTCFLAEQVGLIAGQLKEGEPCPVCGSREHPSPAKAVHQDVTQEKVDAAKERAESLQQELNRLKEGFVAEKQRFQVENAHLQEESARWFTEALSWKKEDQEKNAGKKNRFLTMRVRLLRNGGRIFLRKRSAGRQEKSD